MIYFEWDEKKAARNLRVHRIDFEDASLVFDDPFRTTEEDSVVDGEQRFRTIGLASGIALLLVVYVEETSTCDLFVRIISARKAAPFERIGYEQNHS